MGALPFVQVNVGFLANQIGVSSPYPLDLRQGVHNLLFAIDVGIEDTKDELKVAFLARYKRCEWISLLLPIIA